MKPQDMVIVLEKYGFQGLKLVKAEEKSATFKYGDFNERMLRKNFGEPTITANKKVMVFAVPEIGRIGVSPSNNVLRFIVDNSVEKAETSTKHLGKVDIPEAYLTALEKAKVSPVLRIKWMAKMWEYFNEHKFGGRMGIPKFVVGPKFPGHPATTRGVYAGGVAHTPGRLFLADFLFNARPAFIMEVFLHEMCHQAVWNLDKSYDRSENGHGPAWQHWMTKVGLDPRRFDPTDDTEYMSTQEARQEEAKLLKTYGPRTPDSFWAGLHKAPRGYSGQVAYSYKGRACIGYMARQGSKWVLHFPRHDGLKGFIEFKNWPSEIYIKD